MGDQEETEGQHPDPEHGQDREDAAENEEHACRYASPTSIRMAQAPEDIGNLSGHLVFEVPERSSQDRLAVVSRRRRF
jgi:hypothetical protein